MLSVAVPMPRRAGADRRRVAAATLAVVVTLAVLAVYSVRPVDDAGTGAGGRFATDWRAAVTAYAEGTAAVERAAQSARGGDVDALLGVYRQLETATTTSLTTFRRLTPPAAAADEYDAFLASLEAERSALQKVIAAAETSNTAALPQQVADLATALTAVVQARAEVDAAVAR